MRNAAVARHWRLLLAMRQGARTLDQLAHDLRVTTRTVRRDIDVLASVGFPIEQRTREGEHAVWGLASMREWPRNEVTPVGELDPHRVLADRVVSLECEGLTTEEIAGRLHITREHVVQLFVEAYR